jgi:transcription elongation factor GreB
MLMARKLRSLRRAFRDRAHTLAATRRTIWQTMTRYRRLEPSGSKYITRAGAERLRAELDRLWRVQRPQVTRAVAEAAAQGDRSENAEYTYGKKQLREIDARVRFLRKRLEGMIVVEQPPDDRSRVYFGAWVTLEDDRGETLEVRIVGPDEISAATGYISMDSPLARALRARTVDEEVSVEVPGGVRSYVIVTIRYESAGQSPG